MNEIRISLEKVKELLHDRGDDLSEYNVDKYEIQEYIMSSNEYMFNKSDRTCVVFMFNTERKKRLMSDIKVKDDSKDLMADFISKFYDKGPSTSLDEPLSFIFVFGMTLTPTDYKIIHKFESELKRINCLLTVFEQNELYVNPTKHFLTPKHRKLSITDAKDVMLKHMIKSKGNMPHILKTDPVSKWLGFRTGDVIEIERYNKNSGVSYFYRSCV